MEASSTIPLLPSSDGHTNKPSDDGEETLWGETQRLFKLALPTSVNGVLMLSARLIVTAKVGRLSRLAQSQLALAQSTYNITGLSWVVGMSSGVQTFVGAAHGASASSLKGVILQRGIAIALLTAIVPLLLWSSALPGLLQLLHQQPDMAAGAAGYMWTLRPALLLAALSYCIGFYLQAQRVLWPLAGAMAVSVGVTPSLLHLFIDRAGWGLNGAAAAVLCMYCVEVTLLTCVVVWHNTRHPADLKPWAGFSREAFTAWRPYLAVAMPSCAMICLSWWAFDGLTLVSGLLPDADTAVAASGILFGLHVIVSLAVDGAATSVAIRVGNALGAGRPCVARRAVLAGLLLALAATLACIVILMWSPRAVAATFSQDPRIAGKIVVCLPWLSLALVGDAVNAVLSAAIRGAGRQLLGSVIGLPVFWAVGVPLCILLAFYYELGVLGLWIGMCATSSLQAVVIAAVCARLDWHTEVERSRHLVRSQTSTPPGDRGAGGGATSQVVFLVEEDVGGGSSAAAGDDVQQAGHDQRTHGRKGRTTVA